MTSPRHRRAGMVRSHTATEGNGTLALGRLDDAALLIADPHRPRTGLTAHAQRVMDLCQPGVLSVSEVAYHLQLPGAVVKVIVSRLINSGHLTARAPFVPAGHYSEDVLLEVLRALQKL
ncbi:DUF742 domain-containing protein [Nonomuraea sp. SYSU D8015]|uniref:DUF742 domain-containing protein n=1 Tax=Nonomuraea sp. SYSU D8015 TaxID=2593644 RepID=UPI001CB6C0DE|nr:DUF742 domain-containing protein [Nonomuraea sp. SYSU D8015]